VRAALAVVLARLAQRAARLPTGAFAHFRRLLVQDSTAVGLPAALAPQFPGHANGRGQALAVLNIQCIYDVLAERFVQWYLSSFRVNDQQAAADILTVVQRDDLVIRDLDCFSLETLHQMTGREAFFLSRLWQGVGLWNVPEAMCSARTVCQVYGLRWRIEIVFKSAKTHFHLEAVPQASATEVELLIWARLLLIPLLQGGLATCQPADHDPPLSLLKVAGFFDLFCPVLLLAPLGAESAQRWYCQMRYHCAYEKRKRMNFAQKLAALG
jgi:hypothetical protein